MKLKYCSREDLSISKYEPKFKIRGLLKYEYLLAEVIFNLHTNDYLGLELSPLNVKSYFTVLYTPVFRLPFVFGLQFRLLNFFVSDHRPRVSLQAD